MTKTHDEITEEQLDVLVGFFLLLPDPKEKLKIAVMQLIQEDRKRFAEENELIESRSE